jgi:crotonobetainyl-CoA:carnitine CoA-transferase CaiB-like acyl-CoA transferase
MSQPDTRSPLEGIRILDFTSAWAGPMAGQILAVLGADVIHVEGPGRIDGWRGSRDGGDKSLYPGGEPFPDPIDRDVMFNSQNLGKRSLVVDVKNPDARAALQRVAAQSDVILSNFRAGAIARMGVGYEEIRALQPRIIVVEMPAFGSTGPMAQHGALGPTMELVSGMASLVGYGDGEPIATGPAYLDPIGAYNAAAAVLTALLEREVTGEGMQVEVAQTEAAMNWIGEQFLLADETGTYDEPEGNRVAWAAPHDAFPCRGDDEWVAIAATNDEEWRALRAVLELPDDPRWTTLEGRRRSIDDLDAAIIARTRDADKHELAARLQAAGIPAAPVQNGRDLTESEYLASRGYLTEFDHPAAGRHRYQGLPFHYRESRAVPSTPAPLFGQHTREVLTGLGGLSDHDVDALVAAGAASEAELL